MNLEDRLDKLERDVKYILSRINQLDKNTKGLTNQVRRIDLSETPRTQPPWVYDE